MSSFTGALDSLKTRPRTWLVTGVAGFIGSHLLEALLEAGQTVAGLDNLATGKKTNLETVKAGLPASAWAKFRFIEGSIHDRAICEQAAQGAEIVLHEAAFVSVPLSMEDPEGCNRTNITGFRNVLAAARGAGVKRVVYTSSSAVYGDDATMPKVEEKTGARISPYAESKYANELDAAAELRGHGLASVGLRYFNIFGPRQDPAGGYAAVIPKWITSLARKEACFINGDGGITRDFCHVKNVVQANILAALTGNREAIGGAFNVAYGTRTTLLELHDIIAAKLRARGLPVPAESPVYHPPRPGDIQHSGADISKIRRVLGYEPSVSLAEGLEGTVDWYLKNS